MLLEIGIFDEKLAENLKKLNGLRNILVHRYNKIEEDIILNSLDEIKDILGRFLEVIDGALARIYEKT